VRRDTEQIVKGSAVQGRAKLTSACRVGQVGMCKDTWEGLQWLQVHAQCVLYLLKCAITSCIRDGGMSEVLLGLSGDTCLAMLVSWPTLQLCRKQAH
jgi:hypothetical protein